MNQIVKEECPYCEKIVTASLADTNARKVTRWVAKKGITSSIEYVGNSFTGVGGTIAAQGLKIFFGDTLDKAGKRAEKAMFEIGNFDFYCPNCKKYWHRDIQHNRGNITIRIDHDYVKRFHKKELWGRFSLLILAIMIFIIHLGLLYLCFNWCMSLSSTTMTYSVGFFGLGEGYHESISYLFYFAWFIFIMGTLLVLATFAYIVAKYDDWKKLKKTEFKMFRFNLLTNRYTEDKPKSTTGIDYFNLLAGLLFLLIAFLCGRYCYLNDCNYRVSVEPSIWNFGRDTAFQTNWWWYLAIIFAVIFGIMAISFLSNCTKKMK